MLPVLTVLFLAAILEPSNGLKRTLTERILDLIKMTALVNAIISNT